ncbi:uncharacterized protein LOC126788742 [Argentina anserina]|uniref:uncharacterized protein LOC126788742 n=1 Tax=Argentina anserina TaxID=57926 RepID=UPI0021763698|nr:uncharacterized protein LOC126788742 [Potentilla anserina]
MPEKPATKRPESDQVLNTEQPEMKRQKLDDPEPGELVADAAVAMELQSDSDSDSDDNDYKFFNKNFRYCIICRKMTTYHRPQDCPKKSRGVGIFCFICDGPCKLSTDEHKGDQMEYIKFCYKCGSQARHWTQDCPFSDSESD